jgi:hypothetical protein
LIGRKVVSDCCSRGQAQAAEFEKREIGECVSCRLQQ